MKWQDLISDGFNRILELLEPALAGLTQADLNRQPNPDCNSIGWRGGCGPARPCTE